MRVGEVEQTTPSQNYDPIYGSYAEDGDKIDVREYWRQIRKHKWLVLSLVTIVTTLVAIQAFRTKPWYTAYTTIEIGKDSPTILKSAGLTLSDEDSQYLVNVNTKKLALDNPELFEKVVLDQKLDQNPKITEIVKKKPLFPFLGSSSDTADQSTEETAKIAPYVEHMVKNVDVEQIKNTRALKISYTDEDPKLAADVTNSIARVFMQTSFDSQTEKFTNSANWLDTTTRELKSKVQIAEQVLADYTRDNQIYSTALGDSKTSTKTTTLTTSQLTQLHDQFIRTQTDRMLKKSLYEQVQAGRVAELPEAFSDPKITRYQQQLAELQGQAAELKVRFGPSNPKVVEVQNQIDVLTSQINNSRKALEAKLKADYERTVKDEQSLTVALNSAKVAAANENQASIRYNILQQDVETSRALYTDFLQKTNQAKAQVAEQNNNIKVIMAAQLPKNPVGPKRTLIIMVGFILSLGAGIGLALFIEFLDDSIKSLDDVERYAQLPTLGVIPNLTNGAKGRLKGKLKSKEIDLAENGSHLGIEIKHNEAQAKLLSDLDGHSITGEAYRALRTALLLSSAGNPPKTILVTSGQAGEGKTTTAVNTAISLAQLGAKVVIIDCDLRRPSLDKRLSISRAVGVSNYLSSHTELDGLIQKLEIPNLSSIPAGPIPPNPAELLSSAKMKEMIEELSKLFDHVIIDSPPIISVTDPIILSTLVDGTIMVIHGGKTSRRLVQRSRNELSNVRSRIFGVVLNNVDVRKDGYDYYYYRYYNYKPNDEEKT